MTIRFYETKQRATAPLEPREPGRITMYVCGPTVYNYIHIGNARTFLWFDFIRRYLEFRGFAVTYVMNYTDVDDKIIDRARTESLPPDGVANKYARAFEEDMTGLKVEPPDIVSKATDHIGDMVEAIQGLIDSDLAYESEGDVYFAVEKFPGYGKLSHRTLDDMRAGERVEVVSHKRHPLDFALWKSAKEGEPSWSSPWGPGRPGWHIECSVMSTKYLGMGFDIHGGATDLIFPHHENELAQAEGLSGEEPFVRNWIHCGLVQMDAEKMSKSLGNFVLARDLLEHHPGEALRYWALSSSYRTQAVFSEDALNDAAQAYERWKTFHEAVQHTLGDEAPASPSAPRRPVDSAPDDGPGREFLTRFVEAMDDDFNSPEAFAAVHELVRAANRHVEGAQRGNDADRSALAGLYATFLEMTKVLNFSFETAGADSALVTGIIDYLLQLRDEARAERAFERADAIRSKLQELGVTIEDTPGGTRWRLGGGAS